MRNPRDFFKPLAVGAPDPAARDPGDAVADDPLLRPLATRRSSASCPTSPPRPTSCSATSRTRSPVDRKEAARDGPGEGRQGDRPRRDRAVDARQLARDPVGAGRPHDAGHRDRRPARGGHGPEGRGPVGHPLRGPPARPARGAAPASSGRSSSTRSSRPRSAWPTSRRSPRRRPRMQGMSFGPADLAASRRMKTTRVGGGHPGYRVLADPDRRGPRGAARERPAGPLALLDRAHGRRLHRDRDPAVLRAVRRHQGRRRAARRSSAPRS